MNRRGMPKTDKLEFEAIKYKCVEDVDGEMTLALKISMQDKISVVAIPVKRRLKFYVEILK